MDLLRKILGHEKVDDESSPSPLEEISEFLKKCGFKEDHLNDDVSIVSCDIINCILMLNHPIPFTAEWGETYQLTCPEQYIQAKKALYLNNVEESKRILSSKLGSPGAYIIQGRLLKSPGGDQQKTFVAAEWSPLGAKAFKEFFRLILEDSTHPLYISIRRLLAYCRFRKPDYHFVDLECNEPWGIEYGPGKYMETAIKIHERKGVNLFGFAINELMKEAEDDGLIHSDDVDLPIRNGKRSQYQSTEDDSEPKRAKEDGEEGRELNPELLKISVFSLNDESVQYIDKIKREITNTNNTNLKPFVPVVVELECPEVKVSDDKKDQKKINVAGIQLVDESTSMSGYLHNTRKAVAQIIKETRVGDGIGVCGFSSRVRTIMECKVKKSDDEVIPYEEDSVVANGGTNISIGLQAALDMCHKADSFIKKKIIILMTDGQITEGVGANMTGIRAGERLLEQARFHWTSVLKRSSETFPVIHTIGFGNGYNQDMLYTLAGNQGITFHITNNIAELFSATKTIFGLQANVVAERVRIPVSLHMNQYDVDTTNSPLVTFDPTNKVLSLPDLESGRKVSFNFMISPESIKELKLMRFSMIESGDAELGVPVIHRRMLQNSSEERECVSKVIGDIIDSYADQSMSECSNTGNVSKLQASIKVLDKLHAILSTFPSHLKDESVIRKVESHKDKMETIYRSDSDNERISISKIRRQDIRQTKEGRGSNSWW